MKILLLSILLFVAALLASFFGQGGGVLYTPIQILLGVPFQTAAATSLFLIMVIAFSSTLVYRKAHTVDWQMAAIMEIPTTIGAFIGGFISGYFPERILVFILSGLLLTGAFALNRYHSPASIEKKERNGFWIWTREMHDIKYHINILLLIPVTLLVGFLTSIVGIGGGPIKVPMMVLLFGVPMDIAIGSSAFMVGLTATAGFIGHAAIGHWDWKISLILAIPVFIGGQFGSHFSTHLKKEKLQKWFSWFLILIAVLIFIQKVNI